MQEKQVISLVRENLDELEVVERLFVHAEARRFEAEVQRMANLNPIDPTAPIQAIRLQLHPSIIGMTGGPFKVMQELSDTLVQREPALLERFSYRCRDNKQTAIPWPLWLDIVRYAREIFDPAALDASFLIAKQREGLSSKDAFDELIRSKRANREG